MGSDNLLDLIVAETVKARDKQAGPATRRPVDPEVEALAKQLDRERRAAEREAERRAWQEAERRAAEEAAKRPAEMCGLVEGMTFEVRGCAPEVNGAWIVHRVDPGPPGDRSRSLWARRASGEPGALRFDERKLLDAIHAGLIVRPED